MFSGGGGGTPSDFFAPAARRALRPQITSFGISPNHTLVVPLVITVVQVKLTVFQSQGDQIRSGGGEQTRSRGGGGEQYKLMEISQIQGGGRPGRSKSQSDPTIDL